MSDDDYLIEPPPRPSWALQPVGGFGPGIMGPRMVGLQAAAAHAQDAMEAMEKAARVANTVLDWTPIIGDIKAGLEAIAGENMLGEKLSTGERILTALTILPFGDFLRLGKYGDEAADVLGRHGDDAGDARKGLPDGGGSGGGGRHGDHAGGGGGGPVDVPGSRPGASLRVGPAGTLVGTSTAAFRRDAEKLLRDTPGHPLKFLLDDSGRFKRTRGLDHSELIDEPGLVQMGHVGSKKAGGAERVVLQDAWLNQFDNVTIEHPRLGGALKIDVPVVDIGGVAVELRSAKEWKASGLLGDFDLDAAPRVEL